MKGNNGKLEDTVKEINKSWEKENKQCKEIEVSVEGRNERWKNIRNETEMIN